MTTELYSDGVKELFSWIHPEDPKIGVRAISTNKQPNSEIALFVHGESGSAFTILPPEVASALSTAMLGLERPATGDLLAVYDREGKNVMRITSDGKLYRSGLEVTTDDVYRAAVGELCTSLRTVILPNEETQDEPVP
jgi:hypothetical protein